MSRQFSVRVSDESGDILDKQDNKSQFVDDLILNKENIAINKVPWGNLEFQIHELKELLVSDKSPRNEGSTPAKPPYLEVSDLERKRDEELEYVQDGELAKEIHQKYQLKIDALWANYHRSKK